MEFNRLGSLNHDKGEVEGKVARFVGRFGAEDGICCLIRSVVLQWCI